MLIARCNFHILTLSEAYPMNISKGKTNILAMKNTKLTKSFPFDGSFGKELPIDKVPKREATTEVDLLQTIPKKHT
jgi:hypothetical protein